MTGESLDDARRASHLTTFAKAWKRLLAANSIS